MTKKQISVSEYLKTYAPFVPLALLVYPILRNGKHYPSFEIDGALYEEKNEYAAFPALAESLNRHYEIYVLDQKNHAFLSIALRAFYEHVAEGAANGFFLDDIYYYGLETHWSPKWIVYLALAKAYFNAKDETVRAKLYRRMQDIFSERLLSDLLRHSYSGEIDYMLNEKKAQFEIFGDVMAKASAVSPQSDEKTKWLSTTLFMIGVALTSNAPASFSPTHDMFFPEKYDLKLLRNADAGTLSNVIVSTAWRCFAGGAPEKAIRLLQRIYAKEGVNGLSVLCDAPNFFTILSRAAYDETARGFLVLFPPEGLPDRVVHSKAFWLLWNKAARYGEANPNAWARVYSWAQKALAARHNDKADFPPFKGVGGDIRFECPVRYGQGSNAQDVEDDPDNDGRERPLQQNDARALRFLKLYEKLGAAQSVRNVFAEADEAMLVALQGFLAPKPLRFLIARSDKGQYYLVRHFIERSRRRDRVLKPIEPPERDRIYTLSGQEVTETIYSEDDAESIIRSLARDKTVQEGWSFYIAHGRELLLGKRQLRIVLEGMIPFLYLNAETVEKIMQGAFPTQREALKHSSFGL